MKLSVRKNLLSLSAGLPITAAAGAVRGLFSDITAADKLSALCDGAFAAGVLLLCGGTLIWALQKGALDGLSFTLRQTYGRPWKLPKDEKPEKYADYRARMSAKKSVDTRPLMLSGAVWLILSAITLAAYYAA